MSFPASSLTSLAITPSIGRGEVMANYVEDGNVESGNTIMSAVLFNPLILDNIFSKLDVPTLKSIRRVCSLWGNVGAAPLGRQTFVQADKHCPLSTDQTHPFLTMGVNTQIFHNLNIFFNCTYERRYQRLPRITAPSVSMLYAYFPILSLVGSSLVELELRGVPHNFFKAHFLDIFAKIKFRTLKKIYIYEINFFPNLRINPKYVCSGTVLSEDGTISYNFLELGQLTEFVLDWHGNSVPHSPHTPAFEKGTEDLHPIFQHLIYAAPNLKVFKNGNNNFYPDLSRNGKLVELDCYAQPPYYDYDYTDKSTTFDLKKVSKMIDQVRVTLVKLSLEFAETIEYKTGSFYLPSLPRLTSLKVDLRCNIRNFLNTSLPALNNLELVNCSGCKIRELKISHSGIQELCIIGYTNRYDHSVLVTLFPNVKRVKLFVVSSPGESPGECIENIELLQSWNLSNITMKFYVENDACDWIAVLDAVGRLKGTKNLTIWGNNSDDPPFPWDVDVDDSKGQWLDKLESSFSLYSDKDHIKLYHLHTRTLDEITRISKERNLHMISEN